MSITDFRVMALSVSRQFTSNTKCEYHNGSEVSCGLHHKRNYRLNKVQVVDKFRPRKSKDSSVHSHTILVQDKREQQVSIVLYNDDIPKYEKLFLLFHTHLVSYVKVRDPHSYSIRAGTYEWIVNRYTIVESITGNDGLETPLPTSEKLNALSFSAIEHQHPGAEFVVTICQPFFTFCLALSTSSNGIACTDEFCFLIPASDSRLSELTFGLLV